MHILYCVYYSARKYHMDYRMARKSVYNNNAHRNRPHSCAQIYLNRVMTRPPCTCDIAHRVRQETLKYYYKNFVYYIGSMAYTVSKIKFPDRRLFRKEKKKKKIGLTQYVKNCFENFVIVFINTECATEKQNSLIEESKKVL